MAARSSHHVASDMDEHSKLKADARAIIKEAMDTLSTKDDKVVSAYIKRKFDDKYGPTWHCIVGEDFKAAIAHESKTFFFLTAGKTHVLLYKCG